MRINTVSTNKTYEISSPHLRKSSLTFGRISDKFVKIGKEKTYAQAKMEVQQKFQPAISQLRAERKETTSSARQNIINEFINQDRPLRDCIEIYMSHFERAKNEKSMKPFFDVYNRIQSEYYQRAFADERNYEYTNCIMLCSKDKYKYTPEETLRRTRTVPLIMKMFPSENLSDKQLFDEKAYIYRKLDFKTLKDTFKNDGDFQEAIYNALEKNEENYKKTGRSTILHIENLERLIDKNLHAEDIGIMKDIMGTAGEDYHTLITCINTDASKSDLGTLVGHRTGYMADLDKLGIDKLQVNSMPSKHAEQEITPVMEKVRDIYRTAGDKYDELTEQIESLQTQCKKEVAELDKNSYAKGPIQKKITPEKSKSKEKFSQIKKSISHNKGLAIFMGFVAASAATAIILNKKGIFTNLKHKKTNSVNTSDNSKIYSVKTPSVFNDIAAKK